MNNYILMYIEVVSDYKFMRCGDREKGV